MIYKIILAALILGKGSIPCIFKVSSARTNTAYSFALVNFQFIRSACGHCQCGVYGKLQCVHCMPEASASVLILDRRYNPLCMIIRQFTACGHPRPHGPTMIQP